MDESPQPAIAPATREALVARIQAGCQQIRDAIAPLSEAELAGPSSARNWAVKDHLVHLGRWAQGMIAFLDRRGRFAAMGLDEAWVFAGHNVDAVNDVIYEQTCHFTPLEAKAAFETSFATLMDALSKHDYAALQQTYSYFQPNEPGEDNGRPGLDWVIGNSYEHCAEHLPWIQARIAADRNGG